MIFNSILIFHVPRLQSLAAAGVLTAIIFIDLEYFVYVICYVML